MSRVKVAVLLVSVVFFLCLAPITVFADEDTEAPTAPANLQVTDTTASSISLSWSASTDNIGVTGYNIYSGITLLETVTTTTFTATNLSSNAEYTFSVEAKDEANNLSTQATIAATTLLSTPTNISTTPLETSIGISWDSVADADEYEIYNGQTLVGTETATSYTLNNLAAGTEYTIGIIAKDTSGAGNTSAQATATCYTLLPAPTNVLVTPHTMAIDISWNAVSNAQTYEVKVNDNVISDITGTTYTYQGLTPGESYSVQVRGINGNASGIWCAVVSGSTNLSTSISGTISSNTTLTINNSPYVFNNITISQGVTLTINSGVVIYNISESVTTVNGTLNAIGTSQQPIIFTTLTDPAYGGDESQYWDGIKIGATGELTADNVKIKYAGDTGGAITTKGNLSITNSEITDAYRIGVSIYTESVYDITIDNNIIECDSRYAYATRGISITKYTGGDLSLDSNNITNNDYYTIYIDTRYFSPTSLTGNVESDTIGLHGVGSILTDLSFSKSTYILESGIKIPEGKILSFEPGCVIKSSTISSNYDGETFEIRGTLNAVGTSEEPIIFTSRTDTVYGGDGSEYWGGFKVESTGMLNMDNAQIRCVGDNDFDTAFRVLGEFNLKNSNISDVYEFVILISSANADICINNNSITSDKVGISISQFSGGSLSLDNNDITRTNTTGDYYSLYIDTRYFSPTTINGDVEDNIIGFHGVGSIQADLSFSKSTYILESWIKIPEGKTLSFAPGSRIEMYYDEQKNILINGTLNAIGTAEDPIVFTSTTDREFGGDGSEYWGGIEIGETGIMTADYVKIRYAGDDNDSTDAALRVLGELELTNSEITDAYEYGVYISTTSLKDIIIENNLIECDSRYPYTTSGIYIYDYSGGVLSIDNNIFSAVDNKVYINFKYFEPTTFTGEIGLVKLSTGGSYAGLTADISLPKNTYECDGTIYVGGTLTIAPGTVMKFRPRTVYSYKYKSIVVQDTLNAIGTIEQPIIFTSMEDPMFGGDGTEYWNGIEIIGSGHMNVDYARIRYSGRSYNEAYAAILDKGNLSISNSEISNGYGSSEGIYIKTTTSPTIKYNTFSELDYAIYNYYSSTYTVDAEHNYWNSQYGPGVNGCRVSAGVDYSPYFGYDLCYMHHFGQTGVYGPSGSYSKSFTDLLVSNSLQSLEFSRTYNSKDFRTDTLFGQGWSFSFEGSVSNSQSVLNTEDDGIKSIEIQGEKIVRAANGAVYTFTDNGDGTFTAKNSKGITLVQNGDSTFTLTTKDQTQINYNSDGKMVSLVDKYGNTIEINYTNDKISSIVDAAGNTFNFTYSNGLLVEIEDVSGNRSVTYEYDNGKLVRVIDPTGKITRYAYDAEELLDNIKDSSNNTTESVVYDHTSGENDGKVSEITDVYGNTTAYSYDNVNRIVTKTDSNSRISRQWYDESFYIIQEQDAGGEFENTVYNLTNYLNIYGEIQSKTDRNGNQTSYTWDTNGNMTMITNPDSSTKVMTYDTANNLLSAKDEEGLMTYYVYDASKVYLEKVARPLNGTTTYDGTNDSLFAIKQYTYYLEAECISLGYDIRGLIKTQIDAEGGITSITYDANGNRLTTTDPEGNVTTYVYNDIGWLIQETSPEGYDINYTYDGNGAEVKKVLNDGQTYRTAHDIEGRVIKQINPNLYQAGSDNIANDTYAGDCGTRYVYYVTGEIMTMTDAEGNETNYTYDDYGNVLTETKASGAIFRYEYDRLNRITKKRYKENSVSPEILLEEYTYIILAGGNTRTVIKSYLNSTDYIIERKTYDYANRLIEAENPDGTSITTVYNENGTEKEITDVNGQTTYYKYDGLNRVSEKWVPFEQSGANVLYTYSSFMYDKNDNLISEQKGKTLVLLNNIPATFISTTYTYYDNGLLESITKSSGDKTEYVYDEDGNLASEKDYIDATNYNLTEYENNLWGKPSVMKVYVRKGDIFGYDFSNNDSLILQTSYAYDDNGNLETTTRPDSATITYAYDNMDRPISESITGLDEYGNNTTITSSQQYDSVGNLSSMTDANGNQTTYVFNGLDQQIKIVDADGETELSEYDWIGNLMTKVSPLNYTSGVDTSTLNRTEYTYDEMGRVITISNVYYDDDSLQWVSYVTKAYKYDDSGNVVKELDALGYADGTGVTAGEIINSGYGVESVYNYANLLLTALDPVSDDRALAFTTKYDYDALGRNVSETNANGNIKNYYYDDADNLTSIKAQEDALSSEIMLQINTYDELGNVLTTTDGNGNTTAFTYNAFNELRSAAYPYDISISEYVVDFQYDENYNLVYKSDNNDMVELYTFDSLKRQLSYTQKKSDDTDVITTQTAYDKVGNARFVTDANGTVTEYTYDDLNRMVSSEITVSSITQTTTYTYDENGNQLTKADWLGNIETYVYDSLNRLVEKEDANNVTVEVLEYNNNDIQISSTDALNNTTEYTYDENNRPLTTEDSGGDITGQTYDNVGNISTVYDGENNTTSYDYDQFGQLTEVTNALSELTTYTYDLNGNMLTQTDGEGNTKTYEYNAINLVVRAIDHGGRTGAPGSYVYDSTKTVNYTYYKNGDLYTMTDREGNVTTYTYDRHTYGF